MRLPCVSGRRASLHADRFLIQSRHSRPQRKVGYAGFQVVAGGGGDPVAVTRARDEEDAVRVLQELRPAVVSLQNTEGSGTGILV